MVAMVLFHFAKRPFHIQVTANRKPRQEPQAGQTMAAPVTEQREKVAPIPLLDAGPHLPWGGAVSTGAPQSAFLLEYLGESECLALVAAAVVVV